MLAQNPLAWVLVAPTSGFVPSCRQGGFLTLACGPFSLPPGWRAMLNALRLRSPLRAGLTLLLTLWSLTSPAAPSWQKLIQQDDLAALQAEVGAPAPRDWLQGPPGASPLVLAVQQGARRTVAWLLAQGADVNARSARGSTALSLASYQGDVELIQALVAAGADVGAKSPNGYQPLDWALERGQLPALSALVAAWAKRAEEPGSLPLLQALADRDTVRLNALLHAGHDPNQPNPTGHAPLALAAHGLQVDAVRLLIEAGAQVSRGNAVGRTPLYIAARQDRDGALTDLLLARGAALRQQADDGYDPLDVALEQRNRRFLTLALRHLAQQAPPAEGPLLALNLAVLQGDSAQLQRLLARGVPPQAPNASGLQPLSLAVGFGEHAMARVLLQAGADPALPNDNRYRSTPLMESTRDGHVDLARLLLARGAPVNQLDVNQDHALNWAVFFGQGALVDLLLQHQASLDQRGRDSQENALDIARRRPFPEVLARLEAAVAKAGR